VERIEGLNAAHSGVGAPGFLQGRRRIGEAVIRAVLLGCAATSILVTAGIIFTLGEGAVEFFSEINIGGFLTGTDWAPDFGAQSSYGVLPLVVGTLLIAGIGLLVAVPLGLATAIYLSEYASERARRILKPTLEILAGIPTIVLGFFAINFVTEVVLRTIIPGGVSRQNALSAGIVVGIMIIPTIASLSEDAMRAVPRGLREAAFGLGAGRRVVSLRVVVPAALSGIAASIILAFARAIGETMIVAIASGAQSALSFNPLDGMQTMTAAIVQLASGEIPIGSIEYKTIFALGSTLFVMTFVLNYLSHRIVRRFREAYD